MKNELITYNDGSLELNVPVSWDEETVWLTRSQMADLFDRDIKTIGKHINNALMEELEEMNQTTEYEVITIPVSDGTEREFAIMDSFEVEGKHYIAVSLIEEDEIKEGVYLYRAEEEEDGELSVERITLPAEYKKVSKAYEKLS